MADKVLDSTKEFLKRFNTITAKLNLVLAYKHSAEVDWEELQITNFAIIRNYGEFCSLDLERLVMNFYPDQDYDFETLEKKLAALNAFLTLVLKRIDARPI